MLDTLANPIIDWYTQQGMELIPLFQFEENNPESKRPLDKQWTIRQYTPEQLKRFAASGHSLGVRLGERILVIDVDVKESGDGRARFNQLQQDVGIDPSQTFCVWSDHGSFHVYYRIPPTVVRRHASEYGKHVEFLTYGAQVVCAGSRHWNGGVYNADFPSIDSATAQIADAPESLLAAIRRPERIQNTSESLELATSEIRDLLAVLDPTLFRGGGGDSWPRLMFSVHHACRGSEDGLRVFLSWCMSDPLYREHEHSIRNRWASCSIGVDGEEVTAGTLLNWARHAANGITNVDERKATMLAVSQIEAVHGYDDIPEMFDAVPEIQAKERLQIQLSTDLSTTVDETERTFARMSNVFTRGGKLVCVRQDRQPPSELRAKAPPVIEIVPRDMLAKMVSEEAAFYEVTKKGGNVAREVPQRVINTLHVLKDWPNVPVIKMVITAPCMLPDGSVLQTPGFNRQYGIDFHPAATYPDIPVNPTREQAVEAMGRLKSIITDFPFAGGNNSSHRSVPLAMMLTIACRSSFEGSIPLFTFDGNMAGVGKTLLADVSARAITGQNLPTMHCPASDEEMGKQLVALALRGATAQTIDNVPNGQEIDYPSLDQVLTSSCIESRLLGSHESTGQLDFRTVLSMTGNNMKWGGTSDTGRRCCYCRLDFEGETPENRSDFRHGDEGQLIKYVRENHAQFVVDALTVLRAYTFAGSPQMKLVEWGSYSEWSRAVRAPLVWVGEPDPYDTRHDMLDLAGQSRTDTERVLEAWLQLFRDRVATIGDVVEHAMALDSVGGPVLMHDVMAEILDPAGRSNRAVIGKKLAEHSNRWVNGLRLEQVRKCKTRGWALRINAARAAQTISSS